MSWPVTPDAWLDEWVIWRFRGSPTPRPPGVPAVIPAYALEVQRWCAWRRKGKPDPRPKIPTSIPAWAQPILGKLNAAVPIAIKGAPEPWVITWAIWRFRNSPPDERPSNLPAGYSVTDPWVWSFLRWAGWKRKGGTTPRPKDVPSVVPQWCWGHLKQINIAVPLKPPAPPPPPPKPVPGNSWKLSGAIMFTTWGWMSDAEYRDTDQALAWIRDIAQCRIIGLQIGQYAPDVPDRCRAYGFKVALWGSPDSIDQQALIDAEADAYIPQIEGPHEYDRCIANLQAGYGEGLSRSIVTTLSGLDHFITLPSGQSSTVEAEAIKATGVTHGWVECYKQGGPSHFPISKMRWSLGHRGIPHFSPLIGLYWDVPVSDYQPEVDAYGKQVGSYTAETMRLVDRVAFGQLGT
jgi:hypothetical protein